MEFIVETSNPKYLAIAKANLNAVAGPLLVIILLDTTTSSFKYSLQFKASSNPG